MDVLQPYAPAAWRLARHQLGNVVLTTSHILITHRASKSGLESPLRGPNWNIDRPASRSREEARALAANVAREAQAKAEPFAALVRRYSEDVVTNAWEGSLGARRASLLPDAFLDALATMKPGDVSRVVETPSGFHVLQLRQMQPPKMVSAARILIAHRETVPFPTREGRVQRSRADAAALARRVADEASADPSQFAALVNKYTDHADVVRAGDMGTWSTHDASVWSLDIDIVAREPIGHVSPPIEGPYGFTIYLRTPLREPEALAVHYVEIPHEQVPALERELSGLRAGDELVFEQLQASHCCREPKQWWRGRGDPRLEQLVTTLPIGAIHRSAIEQGSVLRFYKRVAPAREPAAPALTAQLPSARKVDVDFYVTSAPRGEQVASFVASVRRTLGPNLGLELDPDEVARVGALFRTLEERMRVVERAERLAVLAELRSGLLDTLGQERFAEVQANIQSALARKLIGAAP